MELHDAYPRLTPYEHVTAGLADGEADLDAVVADAGAADLDVSELRDFMALPRVTTLLQGLRPEDVGGEAVHPYAALLHHATLFRRCGAPFWLLSTGAARRLVADAPPPGEPRLPAEAGYVQLPRLLFWVRPAADAPAEPVDGIFWAAPDRERLSLLVVAGLRPDRAGVSALPLPDLPLADAPAWLDAACRPRGGDFTPTLPGGEMEGLISLETAGEVLKLLARFFALVSSREDLVEVVRAPAAASPGAPLPSGLPARRVRAP